MTLVRAAEGLRPPRWNELHVMFGVLFAVVAFLVGGPLIVVLLTSVSRSTFSDQTFTLQHYGDVYLRPATYELLANTLAYAALATSLALVLAFTLAWLIGRTDVPWRRVWVVAILGQMGLPIVVLTLGWQLALDPRIGVVNLVLRGAFGSAAEEGPFNVYTIPGMAFVGGVAMAPTAFLFLLPVLRQMDPLLASAAKVAGAPQWKILRHVTLPLALPALLSALIWFFISSIEQFEIPGVLGLRRGILVLSTKIYWSVRASADLPEYGVASALAAGLLVLSALLLWAYRSVVKRGERFRTITGRAYRPKRIELGAWRWAGAAFAGCFALVSFGLPLAVLAWNSLQPFYTKPSLAQLSTVSLRNYASLLSGPDFLRALSNTLILMAASSAITVLLGVLIAWFVVRRPVPGYQILDTMSFMPFAIPSAVIALALILLFSAWQVGLYGTIWIIALASVIRYLPWTSRSLQVAQAQIHDELEKAGAVAGAGAFTVMRHVVLPLLWPALVGSALWVALHAMREAASAVMLGSTTNVVLASRLWELIAAADFNRAAALGVLFAAVAMALGLVVQRSLGVTQD